jgi:hypothetical protein
MVWSLRLVPIALALGLVGATAGGAADEPAPPPSDLEQRICDTYGPGYRAIAGTSTCLKVTGSVIFEVTIGSGGSSGSTARRLPPAPKESN